MQSNEKKFKRDNTLITLS